MSIVKKQTQLGKGLRHRVDSVRAPCCVCKGPEFRASTLFTDVKLTNACSRFFPLRSLNCLVWSVIWPMAASLGLMWRPGIPSLKGKRLAKRRQ